MDLKGPHYGTSIKEQKYGTLMYNILVARTFIQYLRLELFSVPSVF